MKKFIVVLVFIITALLGGCNVIGVLVSPAASDKKIPAEYDIAIHKGNNILIYVDSDGSSVVPFTRRNNISEMTKTYLIKKTGLKEKNFISQSALSDYLIRSDSISRTSFLEIAKKLGADVVLYVLVGEYSFSHSVGQQGQYYKGTLVTYSSLYDVGSSQRLWPVSRSSKRVRNLVRFLGSKEQIDQKLVSACAYCISRYLYDCKANTFRINDEIPEMDASKW